MTIKIVGIDGTVRDDGRTRALLKLVGSSIVTQGAEFVMFSQQFESLPTFDERQSTASSPAVQRLFHTIRGADAFVLSSPEYHGSMSGALKNALDWLAFRDESAHLEGRVFGLIGGGGALANSGATIQMMMAVRALHGWLMPDVIVSIPSIKQTISLAEDASIDPKIANRVDAFSEKLVRYAREFQQMRERIAA